MAPLRALEKALAKEKAEVKRAQAESDNKEETIEQLERRVAALQQGQKRDADGVPKYTRAHVNWERLVDATAEAWHSLTYDEFYEDPQGLQQFTQKLHPTVT